MQAKTTAKKPDSLPPRISRKAAYTFAAGAAASGLSAKQAEAVVLAVGPVDIEVVRGLEAFQLNIDGDDFTDVSLSNYVFNYGNYQGATVTFAPGQLVGFQAGLLSYASALAEGDLIGDSTVSNFFEASLAYGAENPSAQFNDVDGAYIGLSFPITDFGDPETDEDDVQNLHFGWVRVTINNEEGVFVVNNFAYETEPGVGILAGDIGSTGVPGDFNNDGATNAADFTVWRDNLGATFSVDAENPLFANGDNTGDSEGVVDDTDYLFWSDNYGATATPSAVSGVPEPATLGLLAAGAIGLPLLRRTREDAARESRE